MVSESTLKYNPETMLSRGKNARVSGLLFSNVHIANHVDVVKVPA